MRSNAKLAFAVAASIIATGGCLEETDVGAAAEGSAPVYLRAAAGAAGPVFNDSGVAPVDAATVDAGNDAAPPASDAGPHDAAADALYPYDDCHPGVHHVKRNFFTGQITNLDDGRTEFVPPNAMELELVSTPAIVAACDLTSNMLSEASPDHVFWYVGCSTADPAINVTLAQLAAKYAPEPILANYKCQRFLREDPIPCGVCDSAN